MHIGHSKQQCQHSPPDPGAGSLRKQLQIDEQHDSPELCANAEKKTLVKPLRDPGPQEQVANKDRRRRNSEQVGVEGTKPQRLELQTDVAVRRGGCNRPSQAEYVDNPHVVVLEGTPEHARRDSLAVVHTSFAGVIAEDAVDHDLLLMFVEPALLTAEPARGLGRRGWHPECGNNTDDAGDQAFKGKQVSPASCAVCLPDVQEAKSQEGAHNCGGGIRDPEVAKTNWELLGFVPEGEEEDRIWNAAKLLGFESGYGERATYNPPSSKPSKARRTKYEERFFTNAWQAATKLQETI